MFICSGAGKLKNRDSEIGKQRVQEGNETTFRYLHNSRSCAATKALGDRDTCESE